ncbi:hypothetical protein FHP29_01840 [Nocardioides albidus]|uniref:Uncharacterized protein n=1 Tax=Nocardioides albidus TaxID=1517589 RepID=A0A5C4WJB0_9ACTN|nr:hypothetical protein FHP29_01840 [Nocardioides albidus]
MQAALLVEGDADGVVPLGVGEHPAPTGGVQGDPTSAVVGVAEDRDIAARVDHDLLDVGETAELLGRGPGAVRPPDPRDHRR